MYLDCWFFRHLSVISISMGFPRNLKLLSSRERNTGDLERLGHLVWILLIYLNISQSIIINDFNTVDSHNVHNFHTFCFSRLFSLIQHQFFLLLSSQTFILQFNEAKRVLDGRARSHFKWSREVFLGKMPLLFSPWLLFLLSSIHFLLSIEIILILKNPQKLMVYRFQMLFGLCLCVFLSLFLSQWEIEICGIRLCSRIKWFDMSKHKKEDFYIYIVKSSASNNTQHMCAVGNWKSENGTCVK